MVLASHQFTAPCARWMMHYVFADVSELRKLLRNRGEGGVGYFNWGNYKNDKLDSLAAASSKEPDPAKREQLIKAALREHAEQVHHIPLHRQVIPWAMRSNVTAVHRADNWLEWRWVTVGARP